jgi:hypothetical protein
MEQHLHFLCLTRPVHCHDLNLNTINFKKYKELQKRMRVIRSKSDSPDCKWIETSSPPTPLFIIVRFCGIKLFLFSIPSVWMHRVKLDLAYV